MAARRAEATRGSCPRIGEANRAFPLRELFASQVLAALFAALALELLEGPFFLVL